MDRHIWAISGSTRSLDERPDLTLRLRVEPKPDSRAAFGRTLDSAASSAAQGPPR